MTARHKALLPLLAVIVLLLPLLGALGDVGSAELEIWLGLLTAWLLGFATWGRQPSPRGSGDSRPPRPRGMMTALAVLLLLPVAAVLLGLDIGSHELALWCGMLMVWALARLVVGLPLPSRR